MIAAFHGSDVGLVVKRLRNVAGWSQVELADKAGTNATMISNIERGRAEPTDELLASLATSLRVDPTFLTSATVEPATEPRLRAYADASAKEVDSRVAFAETAADYIRRLDLQVIADQLPTGPDDPEDDEELEEVASITRVAAGIEEGAVVRNAVRAAERLGCIVLPLHSEMGRHLGMSVRCDGLPLACIAKVGIPGDRQRFTIAHELGHLVLHGTVPPPRTSEEASRLERQANRFAASFLTPGDAVCETLDEMGGRVTLGALQQVKSVWGVSIKMLVGRYRSLGRIDDDQARSLYKQISARRWSTDEPVEVPNEHAQWFAGVLPRSAPAPDLATAATVLASRIGGNAQLLASFADWTEPGPADVADLATWRRRGATTATG